MYKISGLVMSILYWVAYMKNTENPSFFEYWIGGGMIMIMVICMEIAGNVEKIIKKDKK